MLPQAIRYSHRAYVFDNSSSSHEQVWIAEITDGTLLEIKANRIPNWFQKAVLNNATASPPPE